MAASSSSNSCCYMGIEGSPSCCLNKNEKGGKCCLRLAKIECALKDKTTREAFKTFLDERDNEEYKNLVEAYGLLHDRRTSGLRSGLKQAFIEIHEIFSDDLPFEAPLNERFENAMAAKHVNSSLLGDLADEISKYIVDELEGNIFPKFVLEMSNFQKKRSW